MPKPNETMTLKEMRQYVRDKKLNHPEVKLGMKRAELIAGLKKAGHWDSSKKKLDKGQKSFLAGIDEGKELSVDKYTTKYKNRSLKGLRKLLKDAKYKNEKKAIKELIDVKEFMSS